MNHIKKWYVVDYINPAMLFLALFYLAINHAVLHDLVGKWLAQNFTGTYSHGPLVATIFLFVIFKIIRNIKDSLKIQPSMIGLFILLSSQGLLFISILADVNFLQHILIVVSLLAIVWSIYSYSIAKQFILPAAFFMMSFPVWGDAAIPLQKVSIFFTNILLSLTSLPYYREQALFHFPNGIIEIAPECAGLQQLLVSLIIGLLFSMQHKLRLLDILKTLVFISIASIFINSIRIIIIMFIGYYTKMESTLVTQHVLLGWIIYGIGIYLFLYFYSRINFKAPSSADEHGLQKHDIKITNIKSIKYLLTVLVIIIMPGLVVMLITHTINAQEITPISYKINSPAWIKISNTININWKPEYPPGDSLALGEFSNNNETIHLYISKYSHLRDDIEPANMINSPYNKNHWSIYKHETMNVHNSEGRLDKLTLDRLSSKNKEYLDVLTYYLVNGTVTDNLVKTKLAILFGVLRFKYDTQVVCMAIKSDSETENSKFALIDFYKQLKIN